MICSGNEHPSGQTVNEVDRQLRFPTALSPKSLQSPVELPGRGLHGWGDPPVLFRHTHHFAGNDLLTAPIPRRGKEDFAMTESLETAAADDRRPTWESRLAGPMFILSLAFLVVLAGLIHRFPRLDRGDPEGYLILGALAALWLVFLVEAAFRILLHDRARHGWKPLAAAVACALLPPLRMGSPSMVRPDHLWLPGLGWRKFDSHLPTALDRFFSVPMVCFALLVLPLFVLEHYWAEEVRAEPVLALGLDVGTSVIWLAFTVELILMVAVADRPARYCLRHWIDVAIVVLPAFEVLPLLRLLRLGRVLRLEQLLRWGRLQRLHALGMRGWRAFLLLQVVQRLIGRSPERQLKQLQELLQAKEEEMADLRREINELAERIARKALSRKAALPLPGAEPGGEAMQGAHAI
jgi:voltage-gated potassium channel